MRARHPKHDLGMSFSVPAPRSRFSLRAPVAVEGPSASSLLLEDWREMEGGESGVKVEDRSVEAELPPVPDGGCGDWDAPGTAVSSRAAAEG